MIKGRRVKLKSGEGSDRFMLLIIKIKVKFVTVCICSNIYQALYTPFPSSRLPIPSLVRVRVVIDGLIWIMVAIRQPTYFIFICKL